MSHHYIKVLTLLMMSSISQTSCSKHNQSKSHPNISSAYCNQSSISWREPLPDLWSFLWCGTHVYNDVKQAITQVYSDNVTHYQEAGSIPLSLEFIISNTRSSTLDLIFNSRNLRDSQPLCYIEALITWWTYQSNVHLLTIPNARWTH